MTDSIDSDKAPETFGDLPLQPTGSGVADLEVAYEQMRVIQGEERAGVSTDAGESEEAEGLDSGAMPVETGEDMTDSEAHPS